jgi:acetate kinase
MGGLDAVVFTAGVGENSPLVREASVQGLEFLGIKLDKARNEEAIAKEMIISADDSRVTIAAIPTNEELVIAIDTADIVGKSGGKKK